MTRTWCTTLMLSRMQVQALNRTVKVRVGTGGLTEALVAAHRVVVFTEGALPDLIRWNNFCRGFKVDQENEAGEVSSVPAPISFMMAHMRGLCAHLFVDHGESFTVSAVPLQPQRSVCV
jgi:hypothetical protein